MLGQRAQIRELLDLGAPHNGRARDRRESVRTLKVAGMHEGKVLGDSGGRKTSWGKEKSGKLVGETWGNAGFDRSYLI